MGETGASEVEQLLKQAGRENAGVVAGLLGMATLLLGATAVFSQLKESLNTIWDAPVPRGGFFQTMIRDRFFRGALSGGEEVWQARQVDGH